MSDGDELAKVKARIRALTARTVDRGCTEAEAMAAAEKVGELLGLYGLTMTEVTLREEACTQRSLFFDDPRRIAINWLYPALLRFCGCRGWTVGRAEFVLFGLDPDVQMAEYLVQVLAGALAREEAAFRASPAYLQSRAAPQASLRSFRIGFAARVAQRLDAMGASQAAAAAARPPGAAGTAMVLLKEQRIEEGFRALGVRLRSVSRSTVVRDAGAYGQGQAAGGRVGLNRPVHGAPGATLPRR
jgi:hypothetical protein